MQADEVRIEVSASGVEIEPQLPRFERDKELKVRATFSGRHGVESITLKDFQRLGDRRDKGNNGKRPVLKRFGETLTLTPSDPGPKPLKLADPDFRDTNERYVKFTLGIEWTDGKKFDFDPMWDEMP